MRTSISLALLLALVGCSKKAPASDPTPPTTASEGTGGEASSRDPGVFLECTPQSRGAKACTMDYSPVCGQHADTKPAKTYGNVCGACADANVTGYFKGECETGTSE